MTGTGSYGTLADYTTDRRLRPATREEWERTAAALDAGEPEGAWHDGDLNDGFPVYVDGGPDPVVTDDSIRALHAEAGTAGDSGQVALCDRALDGDASARAECVRVIREARCREAEAEADSAD